MTGLLSIFSLLPVQALKKKNDGEEQEEEDSAHTTEDEEPKISRISRQDDGESSDKDTERYNCNYTKHSE